MIPKSLDGRIKELQELYIRLGAAISSLEAEYRASLAEGARTTPQEVSISPSVVSPDLPSFSGNRYEVLSVANWFSALEELRRQGSGKTAELNGRTYVRPFTIKENLQARIEDYSILTNPDGTQRTEEERRRFFKTWLDSCSGIHYLAGTTKSKIVPQSPQLITLAQAPTKNYLAVPFSQSQGIELDKNVSRVKYNCNLSRAEVLEHPAWLAVAEEDKALLGEAFDVLRQSLNASADWKGMSFYLWPNKPQDELRPLCVGNRDYRGDANGGNLLNDDGRFLRR